MIKHLSILLESEMERAEVVLAVKSLTNDLQTMAQKISKMQIEEVSALTERIKAEFGIETGEDFANNTTSILQNILTSIQNGKSEIDNSALILSGDYSRSESMFDGDVSDKNMEDEIETDDMFAGHDASAAGSEPVGRVKKEVNENKVMDDALKQIQVAFSDEMKKYSAKNLDLARKAEMIVAKRIELSNKELNEFYNDLVDMYNTNKHNLETTDKNEDLGHYVVYKGDNKILKYAKEQVEKMLDEKKQNELNEMINILRRKGLTESDLYKKAVKMKESATKAFSVFLKGKDGFEKKIDTVFFGQNMTETDVKKSLINHDGYDANITVVAESKKENGNVINEAFTRKHFQMVANTLKNVEDEKKRKDMAEMHADAFAKENPRFDRMKFLKASGVEDAEMNEAFTRKHFKMIADTLKNISDMKARKDMAEMHAEMFAKENPRFDRSKFFKAADVVMEAWDAEMETPESKKGMFDGWTLKELEAERTKLKSKKDHTKAETTMLRRINFAIRAKRGWGKVEEGCKSKNIKKK